MSSFGDLVRRLRKDRTMTLEQVARKVGSHKGYVSGIENGKVNPPSVKFIRKFAKLFAYDERTMVRMAYLDKAPKLVKDEILQAVGGAGGAAEGCVPVPLLNSVATGYANELVEFIRAETGDWFEIEVAAYPEYHPQSRSPADDLQSFVRKVNAGADSAITQYFYNFDAYARFVDDVSALGCTVPIVAGVMPIINYTQLARFSDACGAEIPRWIRQRLESFGDDRASIREFGLDVVTHLCEQLLAVGAPGLHFYTLNQAEASIELCRRLG